ncbi:MAG: AAA family ATPase [Muribaculaceae bacterium]|nr:AAA family ATPase [Muribaculaceae bacterium]
MERFFNTAGPNKPEMAYTLDPLSRIDLDDILMLIRQAKYFVLHAPRQTGKTSCLLALRDYLNAHDDYIAVYANVEGGQAMRNNVAEVIQATVNVIATELADIIGEEIPTTAINGVVSESASTMLSAFLTKLSKALPKPLVLFIDEIDSLVGDSKRGDLQDAREPRPQRGHHPRDDVPRTGANHLPPRLAHQALP